MWKSLSDEWGLTPEQHRLFDLREGTFCAFCRAPVRAMHLAAALLDDVATTTGRKYDSVRELAADRPQLRIAEINEISGLHKHLAALPGLVYSEYGTANSEDLMALSYADASFAYVLTSDTLEHVPDFDVGLAEIRRVLKPAGRHIFTIPVLWDRPTRQRAALVDGKMVHHLPPSYHGRAGAEEYLVFNEFGGDVVERIEAADFDVKIERDAENSLVATFVCTKR
jgi:SAM-dependent methyltransferase